MLDFRTPAFRLGILLLLVSIVLASTLHWATRPFHFAEAFKPTDLITSPEGSITLEAIDFTPEPGEFVVKAELDRFFERQSEIQAIISSRPLLKNGVEITEGRSSRRPMEDLPPVFWIQIVVGLGAALISSVVYALRYRDKAAQLFAASGFATMMFTFSAAIYSTRELSLPLPLFKTLTALNGLGASLFGICTFVLFLYYPKKLRARSGASLSFLAFFGLWTAFSIGGLLPAWANVNLITLLEMLGITIAIACQFYSTKGQPKERAALTWLGLSFLLGAGFFIAFNALPLVLGQSWVVEQGYLFLSFLFIYIGLAAGISRFRLFHVGTYAFRFFFYSFGAILLLGLDAIFLYFTTLERLPALSLSLFIVSLGYFPLKAFIAERLRPKCERLSTTEILDSTLRVAFAPTVEERYSLWKKFLAKAFDPLEMIEVSSETNQVRLEDDGSQLSIPSVGEIPSLRLKYRSAGRSLFNGESIQLAELMVKLLAKAKSTREAYDQGVLEERRRVAQDLHDDVGAKLLSVLEGAEERTKTDIQSVLTDIRALVNPMSEDQLSLEEVLGELRFETQKRLSSAGIRLLWSVDFSPELSASLLSYREHKTLRSGLRELVSNTIRHSGASEVRVVTKFHADSIFLEVVDNGRGLSDLVLAGETKGFGFRSLRLRMEALGGRLHLSSSREGAAVAIDLPREKS